MRRNVRLWPKATFLFAPHMSALGKRTRLRESAFAVAIRGKADMVLCGAHVCF
jgi:hypothetical protein